MIVFPNCKINLGLHITGKRPDGYHNLETVFYPVPCTDILEIIPADTFTFTTTGIPIPGGDNANLCTKAYQLLQQQFPQLPPVHIHLHKVIPMGAGLGGGSADGAFTLTLLNKKYDLGLTQQQLQPYALTLGSDCPFFINNKPAFATGRGEVLTEVPLDLSAYNIVLVNPGIHLSTAQAFAMLHPGMPPTSLQKMIQQPVETWKNALANDFEQPVFKLFPVIAQIKADLYNAGAVYASMSGSGSTVFGLFNKALGQIPITVADGYTSFHFPL